MLNKYKFDIISIGDATLDVFLRLKDAIIIPSKEEHNPMLCLAYADKIPVRNFEQRIAGNALNNAVGSSRLGMRAAFYSIIGNDDRGRRIINGMKKEKVSLKYLKIDKKSVTNFTAVLNYNGERTQLIYHVDREYRLPKLGKSKWIYYTEIGKNHINLESEIVEYIKKTGAKLCFNPGISQLARGVKGLKKVLEAATILFLNKEEAKKLVGQGEADELLKKLFALGPKIVVITDGSKGACAYDGKEIYCMDVFPVKMIEMTGAGDAFATGFVAAIFYGKKIDDALRWGTANSNSVISHIGPQDGLLTQEGIVKTIRRYTKITPKKK